MNIYLLQSPWQQFIFLPTVKTISKAAYTLLCLITRCQLEASIQPTDDVAMASTKTIFAILISASAVTLLGMYLYGGETIQASIYPKSFTRSSQSEDSPISNTRFALSSRLEPMPKQKLKKASLSKPRAGSKCPFEFEITATSAEKRFHKIGKGGFIHTAYYDGRVGGAYRLFAIGFAGKGPLECILWYDKTDCIIGPASSSSTV